ncbi:N-acetyltransferase [Uruburuella testudinis]|uniref:N-acetyltransferase n=1 Tax=Uruburuella testudinis TaxID=1282863 RepID=A0ABY4DZK4_9NEIS|nr:GNAT family N-acetyltransferase [Uruburuella testudinis]UOO83007.1 N-acetyltransferase [Uruburuella testudinis]
MNQITHHPDTQRFTLTHNGDEQAGYLTYRIISNGRWDINHTVIRPPLRGRGLARLLVEAAIAEAEKQHIRLQASCGYADIILQRSNKR